MALLAAALYGISSPFSKLLLAQIPPTLMAALLYLGAGMGALMISRVLAESTAPIVYMVLALLLGFVAYGLSIYFYISAQRELGAARTSAYYAAAPFIGVLISRLVLQEQFPLSFMAALVIMLAGAYVAISEDHNHVHRHQELVHDHKHVHDDLHHNHTHTMAVSGAHSHPHTHEDMQHEHGHTPDIHHRHIH